MMLLTYEFGMHLATIVNSPTATFCDAFQRLTIDDTEVIVNCDFATMCTKPSRQQALKVNQHR